MTDGRFRMRAAGVGGRWVSTWADEAHANISRLSHLTERHRCYVLHNFTCVCFGFAVLTCSNNCDVIHLFGLGVGAVTHETIRI